MIACWLLFACAGHKTNRPAKEPLPPGTTNDKAPFPEAKDTVSWDLAWPTDSTVVTDDSTALPADSTQSWTTAPIDTTPVITKAPAVRGRPEGILVAPKPKGLPDKIHVLLNRGSKTLNLYSLGFIQLSGENISKGQQTTITKLITLRGRFSIKRAGTGTGFQILQAGKEVQSTRDSRLRLVSVNPYNLIDLAGTIFRGGLHILSGADGGITAVNVLGVEDYLRGVLPYELGTVDREALEALKAQAIVARTYAYRRMMHPGNSDFHVYSDVQDQVYRGVKGEYLLSDRAVWETRGIAVLYQDSLVECYYSSTCGGRTSSKHEVWGGESVPYLISRSDTDEVGSPYCIASKYSAWQEEWSQVKLAGIINKNIKSAGVTDAASFSKLTGLEVVSRASCGRIRVLKISTDKGTSLVKGDKVRWALRTASNETKILPSAWFNVKVAGGQVVAEGRGFGHGVGLCQMGCIARARAKQNYKEIIEAYYKDVQLIEYK